MPILAAEPAAYPPDLFVGDSMPSIDADAAPRQWWVLQTKSRHEKALARDLHQSRIPFYLPLTTQDTTVRGKVQQAYLPVFSGYLFLFGSDGERNQALRTNRIANSLIVPDQEELTRDLRNLSTLIASGANLTIEQQLCPGTRVRVKRGAFEGLEGLVIQRRGTNRLLLAVTYLRQGVSVEIADHMVELLDG